MTQKIIYINSISVAEISQVRKFDRILGDMAFISLVSEPKKLPLVGLARCVFASKIENKSRIWETSLTAKLSESFNIGTNVYIYIIRATDGSQYIIGNGGKPYPLCNLSTTLPDNSSERVAFDLSVCFSDSFGLTRLLLAV